ncbi:MAG: DUF4012 domain-containing protein [Patescibacteria group bacterium]|jgi:hypothetical protein
MSKRPLNNFVRSHPSLKQGSRLAWKRIARNAGIILGVIIIIGGALGAIYWKPAQEVMRQGNVAKEAFFKAQDQLIAQDFSAAQISLDEAIASFESAQSGFKKFTWLKIIPWVGTQVNAVDKLMSAGVSTGRSIRDVAAVGSSIVAPITKNDEVSLATLTEAETHQLLKNIYEAKPKLEEAKKSIDEAVVSVDDIPTKGLLPQIREATAPLKEKVPQLQEGLDVAISASQILPAVAGYPEQKTYLFLLQNNSEMRPTGGFIGTYGILKIKDGDITSFKTDNIYNLDKPSDAWLSVEPPWQLTRYNAAYEWFLRDANWSPDFPTTAKQALWFYEQERGPEKQIDGVIAVTPSFIQSLLTLTGAIKVNGLTFTSENFIDTLQYEVEQGFLKQDIPESERKEIIGTLSKIILDDVLALPKSKWPDLWTVIQNDIAQKQLLVNVNDEYTQSLILKENWGGEIQKVDHDYLAIFDANLASLKSDPVVKRTVDYRISRDGDKVIADLYYTYVNEGTITWKTTRYRTYVRVYTPAGSELMEFDGAMIDCKIDDKGSIETTQELDKTAFGTFVCTEPGETKTLHLKYRLPDRIADQIDDNEYVLLMQKQPGAAAHVVKFDFDFNRQPIFITGVGTYSLETDHTLSSVSSLSQDQKAVIKLK